MLNPAAIPVAARHDSATRLPTTRGRRRSLGSETAPIQLQNARHHRARAPPYKLQLVLARYIWCKDSAGETVSDIARTTTPACRYANLQGGQGGGDADHDLTTRRPSRLRMSYPRREELNEKSSRSHLRQGNRRNGTARGFVRPKVHRGVSDHGADIGSRTWHSSSNTGTTTSRFCGLPDQTRKTATPRDQINSQLIECPRVTCADGLRMGGGTGSSNQSRGSWPQSQEKIASGQRDSIARNPDCALKRRVRIFPLLAHRSRIQRPLK